MECNKEEAIRAKTFAEQKMELKDFISAKKLALMAQRLLPDLENISQMITVCEIHCSAAVKTNGIEDWYGILQVEPSADDSTIKKQYRKLAVSLHPDKNKFSGAEAAFKIVGEAHRVLFDLAKRSAYDIRRTSVRHGGQKRPDQPPYSFVKVPTQCANSFRDSSTVQPNGLKQQQPTGQTFWTSCPFCHLKYRYYQPVMNRSLLCQYCVRPFIAFNMHAQDQDDVLAPAGTGSSCLKSQHNSGNPRSNGFSGDYTNGSDKHQSSGNASSGRGCDVNVMKGTIAEHVLHGKDKKDYCGFSIKTKKRSGGISGKDDQVKSASVQLEEVNGQTTNSLEVLKRKLTLEKPVKSNHLGGNDVAEAFSASAATKNIHESGSSKKQRTGATFANTHQNLASFSNDMREIKCDNWNKMEEGKSPQQTGGKKISRDEHNARKDGVLEKGLTSMPDLKNPVVEHSVPDPEFCDFELQRNRSSFRVDQIWALYDDFDEMPRYYAKIKRVSSHSFKVLFTWLEYNPANNSEKHQSARKLPVACGNYKLGKTQKSKEIAMFSHVMSFEKGGKRNSYKILPRKGEIWALYEDWDSKCTFEPENQDSIKFQIGEIVSDKLTDNDIGIRLLTKVQGFVSVFTRVFNGVNGGELVYVPCSELRRFSHMIPSYKLIGKERDGIPKGSYELDTAALPVMFHSSADSGRPNAINSSTNACSGHATEKTQNTFIHDHAPLKNEREMPTELTNHDNKCSKERILMKNFNNNSEEKLFGCENPKNGQNLPDETQSLQCQWESQDVTFPSNITCANGEIVTDCLPTSANSFGLASVELHRFDEDKSFNKLQKGQIWALYADLDGYPKYYGLIRDVDVDSPKVDIVWLEACPELDEQVQWFEKGLLFGCGRFMPLTGKDDWQTYNTLETFSHQVNAQTSGKQNTYNIYPHVGEIWAMYKNWSADWNKADLSSCEFDIVEIYTTMDHKIKVHFLEKMEGFFTVFTRRTGISATADIASTNMLQFSHQIPSFLLTDERGGRLRGSWELDPASVPEILLCSTGPRPNS